MPRHFYCYQLVFRDTEGTRAYVGQASSRSRVLSHLAASHNKRVQALMSEAQTWPWIQTFPLRHPCLGDLTIMEDALIADLTDRFRDRGGRRSSVVEVLNRNGGRGTTQWAPDGDQVSPEDEFPTVLDSGVPSSGTEHGWRLLSLPVCGGTDAMEDIHQALVAARAATHDPFEHGQGQGLEFLPAPGTEIVRVTLADLRLRLSGRGNLLVVFISSGALADGREAMGPDTTETDRLERAVRYWPVTVPLQKQFHGAPPDTIVAVTGDPSFRLILGAWRVQPDAARLRDGDWQVVDDDPEIPGIAGLVLDRAVHFNQSAYPAILVDQEGRIHPSAGTRRWDAGETA